MSAHLPPAPAYTFGAVSSAAGPPGSAFQEPDPDFLRRARPERVVSARQSLFKYKAVSFTAGPPGSELTEPEPVRQSPAAAYRPAGVSARPAPRFRRKVCYFSDSDSIDQMREETYRRSQLCAEAAVDRVERLRDDDSDHYSVPSGPCFMELSLERCPRPLNITAACDIKPDRAHHEGPPSPPAVPQMYSAVSLHSFVKDVPAPPPPPPAEADLPPAVTRSRDPDPEELKKKWTKIFQLQRSDGFWELTTDLGQMIRLNVDVFANVFLLHPHLLQPRQIFLLLLPDPEIQILKS
ncbi:protein phosphatase 1 regulatory subunit 37 [Austrofundulus limnaeus]|uniref:Protein phosphatase 1 regulatory subunit 37 n=1 Tax=Austrofundulus limnaeus TaxID=52670 RepID=A0A2I4CMP9_AUSLI|nr:PREDICTED: protein phosphatase 1 regulatory subunit 37-like [Austrofundulus limnaeus]